MRIRFVIVGIVCCVVLLSSNVVQAEVVEEVAAPETIDKVIEERDSLLYDRGQRSLFPDIHYQYRELLHEWERKIGLEVTLSYDALVQGYFDVGDALGGTAGDLSLSGKWLLFGNKYNKPFSLSFRIRSRHSFSDRTPADFASETGLLWKTVDGFNDSGVQIPNLYFSQLLARKTLTLNYGQFSIDSFVDNHSMRSAKRFFLNQLFSANPTVSFPSFGAGAIAHFEWNDRVSLTGGVSNIQGTEDGQKVDLDLTSTALFETVQASYRFKGLGGRDGRFQVMVWNSDSNSEEELNTGNGLSLTLEHEGVNKDEKILLRYAFSNGDPTNTDVAFLLAFGKQITDYNQFGIGVGAGRSTVSTEWQGVFETYYKIQLAKELILTPDLQLIVGDDGEGGNQLRFIAGIRLGLTF